MKEEIGRKKGKKRALGIAIERESERGRKVKI